VCLPSVADRLARVVSSFLRFGPNSFAVSGLCAGGLCPPLCQLVHALGELGSQYREELHRIFRWRGVGRMRTDSPQASSFLFVRVFALGLPYSPPGSICRCEILVSAGVWIRLYCYAEGLLSAASRHNGLPVWVFVVAVGWISLLSSGDVQGLMVFFLRPAIKRNISAVVSVVFFFRRLCVCSPLLPSPLGVGLQWGHLAPYAQFFWFGPSCCFLRLWCLVGGLLCVAFRGLSSRKQLFVRRFVVGVFRLANWLFTFGRPRVRPHGLGAVCRNLVRLAPPRCLYGTH